MIYIVAIILLMLLINAEIYFTRGKVYFPIQQAIGLLFFLIVLVLELFNG